MSTLRKGFERARPQKVYPPTDSKRRKAINAYRAQLRRLPSLSLPDSPLGPKESVDLNDLSLEDLLASKPKSE